jgi:uncharacterized protein YecT (DUF1311 family)
VSIRRIGLFVVLAAALLATGCKQQPKAPHQAQPKASAVAPAAAAPAVAAAPALNTMIEWEAEKDGATKAYALGGLTLTFSSVVEKKGDSGDAPTPVLTVSDGVSPPITVKGEVGFDHAQATFGVGRIDPKGDGQQVLFQTFSGGAHCCTRTIVLSKLGGRWRAVDLRFQDGEPFQKFPTDTNGDGIPDLHFYDDGFAYAFDCYACSWMPPVVYEVVGGEARDTSWARRNRALFEKDLADTDKGCRDHENAYCAGYAADAARLGRFDKAWQTVVANAKVGDWELGQKCWVPGVEFDKCPKDKLTVFKTYPQALESFLVEHAYLRAADARFSTSAPIDPSFNCAKAKGPALTLVCATPALVAADHDMAMAYARALAEAKDPNALHADQRAWASRLAASPADVEALKALYAARTASLDRAAAR